MTSLNQHDENDYQNSKRQTPIGRMDASTDEDERYLYEEYVLFYNISYLVMKKNNVPIENQVRNLLLKVYESYLFYI
jgi:hypothetical protein